MGKFTVKEVKTGFHFNLVAANGEVIATSQVYSSKSAAIAGTESIKAICGSAVEDQTVKGYAEISNPKYEVYTDKAGEFRFRLKARNGEIVASSEGYTAKASCLKGIESVKANAPEAAVVEEE